MAQPECNKENLECPRAREVADEAVRRVFAILGVDIDDPEKVEEFRMDVRSLVRSQISPRQNRTY